MAANRTSWIVAGLVIVVVGFLVVRTVRNDSATRSPSMPDRNTAQSTDGSRPSSRRTHGDTTRVITAQDRTSSVEKAKRVLKEQGFYTGPIDGNYDPTVSEAVKKFQASVGMKPTGYLDPKTYEAMGIQLHRTRK